MYRVLFLALVAFAVLPGAAHHGLVPAAAGFGSELEVSRTLAGVACLVLAIGQAASLVIRALRGEPESTRY